MRSNSLFTQSNKKQIGGGSCGWKTREGFGLVGICCRLRLAEGDLAEVATLELEWKGCVDHRRLARLRSRTGQGIRRAGRPCGHLRPRRRRSSYRQGPVCGAWRFFLLAM